MAESKSLISNVLRNLWDPHLNPDGLFNMGVAENFLMHHFLLKSMNKSSVLPLIYLTNNDGAAEVCD